MKISVTVFASAITIIFFSGLSAYGDLKRFKEIEFKNFNYLSNYEIIDRVNIDLRNDEIIIDMDSLEKVLRAHSLIQEFDIAESKGRLTISVKERAPLYTLVCRNGEDILLLELDKNFQIISRGRVHALGLPLIIVNENDIRNKISVSLKRFLSMLKEISSGELSLLISEVEEINAGNMEKIIIRLRGRKTAFIMEPNKENFYRLNYSVGYFDRIRFYPDVFEITNASGIIKKRLQEY